MKKVELESKIWQPHWTLRKYHSHLYDPNDLEKGLFEKIEIPDNVLTYAGLAGIWKLLADVGSAFSPIFDAANAHIGVGDNSGSPTDKSLTDLVASTNKTRFAMEAGYPQTSGANGETLVFRIKAEDGEAEYNWREFAIFNAASGGTMLNRKVQDLGLKEANQDWVFDLKLVG